MSSESMDADKCQILDVVTQEIFVVSDHIPPSQKIEMNTMMIADLAFVSIEVASLLVRLNMRYSGSVSLSDFVIELTDTVGPSDFAVGRIVDFVAKSIQPAVTTPRQGDDQPANS